MNKKKFRELPEEELAKLPEEEREFYEMLKHAVPIEVNVNLGLSTVLSVRMLNPTHEALKKAAEKEGITPAKFARQAIEEKIANTDDAPAWLMSSVFSRLVKKVEDLQSKAESPRRK